MTGLLFLRAFHDLVGGAAVVAAVAAAVLRKGSPAHVRAGRIYVRALLVDVAVTTVAFAWTGDLFLLAIGLISLVLGWSGQREMERRRTGELPSGWDRGVLLGVLLGAILMFALASSLFSSDGINGAIVLLIGLSFGAFLLAATEWRRLHSATSAPGAWAMQHVSAMAASAGGISTSVAVVGLRDIGLPIWLVWLLPVTVAALFAIYGISRIRMGRLPPDPAQPTPPPTPLG